MAKKIIVANLKMNPATLGEAEKLFKTYAAKIKKLHGVEAVFCPPFVYLSNFRSPISNLKLGAQNAFWKDAGAFTGEVSPVMLKKLGAEYVIIGHSERREYVGETDAIVNSKIRAALAAGLKVILCVGERERTADELPPMVRNELVTGLAGVARKYAKKILIAYEPIWAIGTGHPDTPRNLLEMAIFIRRIILDIFGKAAAHDMGILYGGSVTDKNAGDFLGVDGVNGLLVGGASLDARKFVKILEVAAR